jgi:Ca2+-dependent lipid-binding protein
MVKKYTDVVITIIKGTGLFASDINGKSDPLMKLTCNEETHTTAVIPKTVDPVWNEKWTLSGTITSGTKITMELYDQDIFTNDFLGNAEYTFTDKEEDGKTREQTVNVMLKGKNEGTVTLGIFVRHITLDVEVTFVKANALKASDLLSKSDPYIKATLLGQTYQTAVVNNTLDPEWNEKWSVPNVPAGSKLEFDIFDKDVMKTDDFLGHGCYVITENEPLGKKTVTVPVQDQEKEQGTVTLEFVFKLHSAAKK